MSYNGKKFLDINGLKHLISILDDYPTNEVLGTVINAIESEIPTNVSQLQNDAGYLTTHQDISGKANSVDLAAVATSGDYDDLINKPTIPAVPVQDVQVNGTSVVTNGVANVPIANGNTPGVIQANVYIPNNPGQNGIFLINNKLYAVNTDNNKVKAGDDYTSPITAGVQHASTFYGLAKAAGADMKDIANTTVGTYPDAQKAAIQNMLGVTDLISTEEISTATAAHAINSTFMMNGKLHRATAAIAIGDAVVEGTNCEVVKADEVFPHDVQVNGTSVMSDGVANIPIATSNSLGAVKGGGGITVGQTGALSIYKAGPNGIKSGTLDYDAIVPANQHQSVFYGLAKVAGADEKDSTLSVGTYTETAKTAIRTMLGAASPDVIAVQDTQPTNADTKVWLPETQAAGVQVPTMEDLESGYVKKTDIATSTDAGIVKVSSNLGVCFYQSTNYLGIQPATTQYIKDGTTSLYPIAPNTAHSVAFYGLAKAAGDTTQSASDNAVGTYTDGAKTAIRSMLGAVGDVQVNGTSVVSNGVANVPVASSSQDGVVRIRDTYGINIAGGTSTYPNALFITKATSANIKAGINSYQPIVPEMQHESIFYGLAKAAGDTTQSASSNAVGTYTAEAKSAIQQMLGIDLQSIASEVEIPLVETVSGTTPTISGQPNTRYVCGEVSTLSITPPSAGSIDVIFDSGSTPAVITVPNTVRWPAWFDATALEADTTYEILITDGVYGSVMTWAN